MDEKRENLIIGINLGDFGSTGDIMLNSLEYAHENGPFDVVACIPFETKQKNRVKTVSFEVKIPSWRLFFYRILRKFNTSLINDGNYYKEFTNKLINIIKEESKEYKLTIIHMHNMHMCNLNVNKFYKWLSKNKDFKVFYTLHDCWAFTGGCYYYDHIKCREWQFKCKRCPKNINHSASQLIHRTKLIKKIKNLTIIPCSKWLEKEFKQSRLSNIPSIVNNGETSMEAYYGKSFLKRELGIENKKILISVAAYWVECKGIEYLYQLAKIIPNNYVLLLIGGPIKEKHENIIHIPTITDKRKLAEYYSIADVFVSATLSDNLPLVLMEAQICGVPIVGFGHGGTPEEITNKSGIMVGKDNDINKLLKAIIHVVEDKPFKKEDIIASGSRFKKFECAKRQLKIYKKVIYGD